MGVIGSIYLLHFDRPVEHARHYLGWTERDDVGIRVGEHLSGRGSPLVAFAVNAGIGVRLVRTWSEVDRHFERRLKNRHSLLGVCPVCLPSYNEKARDSMRRVRSRRKGAVVSSTENKEVPMNSK